MGAISVRMKRFVLVIAFSLMLAPMRAQERAAPSETAATLDFEFFRTRIQPIFLHKREGLARCYVCHSQGTPFVLQLLSSGSSTWNEGESRKNFQAVLRLVNP